VTIDGGARGMAYYISMGVKGDDSFYKQSSTNYKQYNIRAKLDLPINDWLKTSISTLPGSLTTVYILTRVQMQ
jgi:TonB-dependent starch-binding outer membrane protein SusC